MRHVGLQRIDLLLRAPVLEDELARKVDLDLGNLVEGINLRVVDDSRVKPAIDRFLEEDGVEHAARIGAQAEGDVRDSEHRLAAGQLQLDAAHGLERLHAGGAVVFLTCGDGQRQRVEDQVFGAQAVPVDGKIANAMRDGQLFVGGQRHALFVDGEGDDGRAITAGHGQHLPRTLFAVLKIDRVDDRLAGNPLEGLFDDVRLGRVNDDRRGHARGNLLKHAVHVGDLVFADDGAAEIEHLRAFADQTLGQRENAVVVAFTDHVAEVFAPRGGVHLLGDDDRLAIVFERHGGKGAGGNRLRLDVALERRDALESLGDGLDVRGRGAATAADDTHAVFGDEVAMVAGQLLRRELVDGVAALVLRQTGVGQHADLGGRVLAEKADGVVHLRRSGGAVHANDVGLKALQHGQRRANLRAKQHGAGSLERHLHLQRDPVADRRNLALGGGANRILTGGNGDLGLEQILAGLNQQHIDAAFNKRIGLFLVRGVHRVVADVAERGQLGGGANGAGDEARLLGGRILVGNLAGKFGRGNVQLAHAVGQIVLGKHNVARAKAVGFDNVAASLEVLRVDGTDDVGPRKHEQFVAALFAPEILGRKVVLLHKSAHAAVINEYAPLQFFEKLRQCRSPEKSGRGCCTGKAASMQEYRSLLRQANVSGSTVTGTTQKVSPRGWMGMRTEGIGCTTLDLDSIHDLFW